MAIAKEITANILNLIFKLFQQATEKVVNLKKNINIKILVNIKFKEKQIKHFVQKNKIKCILTLISDLRQYDLSYLFSSGLWFQRQIIKCVMRLSYSTEKNCHNS